MAELIHTRIIAIMKAIGPIAKVNRNQQQGYSFRGIDDIYNALHPILVAHGVYCMPEVTHREVQERTTAKGSVLLYTRLDVRFTLVCAEDASSVSGVVVGEAMDSADKSSNKAMSAAMKYFYFMVFCIPTEGDNDADAMTHPPTSQPRAVPQTPRPPATQPQPTSEPPPDEFDKALCVSQGTPQAAPAPAPQPAPAPVDDGVVPPCPECGGQMYDNRADTSKAVVFKCMASKWDRETRTEQGCSGVIWRSAWLKSQSGAAAPVAENDGYKDADIPF